MIIYKAENLVNGKIYIGKTIENFSKRKNGHKTGSIKNKDNSIFHSAIRKHGFENFEWSIIDTAENETELNEKEKYWIAEYRKNNICYNMTDGGEGMSGYKHTQETKDKISKIHKGRISKLIGFKHSEETKAKIREKRKNQIFTEETRKKISESHTGNKYSLGYRHSDETKKRMSEQRMGNKFALGNVMSDEVCKRISEANKGNKSALGYKHTDEAKLKMSLSRTGEKNPFYGKTLSDEQKIKMAQAFQEKCTGENHYFYGQHHSEESRNKMKEAWKKRKEKRA